jgi:hypothetical protein
MKVVKIIFALVLVFAFASPSYGNSVKRKKNKWLATEAIVTNSEHEVRDFIIGW